MKTPLTRKQRNEACRSSLQDAIRSILAADRHWPLPFAQGLALIEQLRDLKARVKGELPPRRKEPRP